MAWWYLLQSPARSARITHQPLKLKASSQQDSDTFLWIGTPPCV